MSTPVVYGGHIYLGSSSIVRCFDAKTGDKIYAERLDNRASIIASLVAADGKIYCTSEEGTVYVLAAGPRLRGPGPKPDGRTLFRHPRHLPGRALLPNDREPGGHQVTIPR